MTTLADRIAQDDAQKQAEHEREIARTGQLLERDREAVFALLQSRGVALADIAQPHHGFHFVFTYKGMRIDAWNLSDHGLTGFMHRLPKTDEEKGILADDDGERIARRSDKNGEDFQALFRWQDFSISLANGITFAMTEVLGLADGTLAETTSAR